MPRAVLLLQKYGAMLKGNCKNSFCRGRSSLLVLSIVCRLDTVSVPAGKLHQKKIHPMKRRLSLNSNSDSSFNLGKLVLSGKYYDSITQSTFQCLFVLCSALNAM